MRRRTKHARYRISPSLRHCDMPGSIPRLRNQGGTVPVSSWIIRNWYLSSHHNWWRMKGSRQNTYKAVTCPVGYAFLESHCSSAPDCTRIRTKSLRIIRRAAYKDWYPPEKTEPLSILVSRSPDPAGLMLSAKRCLAEVRPGSEVPVSFTHDWSSPASTLMSSVDEPSLWAVIEEGSDECVFPTAWR